MQITESRQPRRTVIVCAGLGLIAAVVAACSSSSKTATTASTAAASGAPDSGAPGAGALATTAEVPVGSGVIRGDVVVTQPTAGVFKGFSSVCTHSGCNVSEVTDGKIICPCHGSEFNLDGTVAKGPAKTSLDAKPVSVKGASIIAG